MGAPIQFSVPTRVGGEAAAVAAALAQGSVAAGGPHTALVEERISAVVGLPALFTTSATEALGLAARLLDLGPGDEVVIPGFTFVSCALAVADRGATPVFADVDPRTLSLDPESAARAIGPRTRAVMVVHYGGVAADLDALGQLAADHGAALIEDAAHAFGGTHRGRPLGSIGDLGVLSFDHQKNLQSGEGGALLARDPDHRARARVLADKGTNRAAFLDGQVDKYTWVDLGGHVRPPDYVAAALLPQLEAREAIQRRRAEAWARYAVGLAEWGSDRGVGLPEVPDGAESTHHIFWLLFASREERVAFTAWMAAAGIPVPFHYQSLAATPAGSRYGRSVGTPVSDAAAERLVRLPLHHALSDGELDRVLDRARAWHPGVAP